jgi:hypothetical protein
LASETFVCLLISPAAPLQVPFLSVLITGLSQVFVLGLLFFSDYIILQCLVLLHNLPCFHVFSCMPMTTKFTSPVIPLSLATDPHLQMIPGPLHLQILVHCHSFHTCSSPDIY